MNKITAITILVLGLYFTHAQNGMTGIYINSDDFINGKITYAGKNTRLKLHELFEKDHLEVVYKDSTFSYLKKDVFGYIDREGLTYRFYDNSIYPILNPYESILVYKKTSGTGMKNSPIVESYFFSKDAGSLMQPLTLENLERAFSTDKVFTDILEIYFKNNDDLAEYDSVHKMYKINRLLEISNHEKNN